jgi:siroheme synthase (precorrin-2 oxidase/ferrochelatase)
MIAATGQKHVLVISLSTGGPPAQAHRFRQHRRSVFKAQARQFYNLDSLCGDVEKVQWEQKMSP